MRVDERDAPPAVGEALYDPASHLRFKVLTYHGDGPHTLLGQTLEAHHYTVEWECQVGDSREQRLSIVQMYDCIYEEPAA